MSNSPQFIRTDKAIMQALITLVRERPFEKITVQDILRETPVTRATFYAHYHDKYEIVERMLEHFFQLKDALREKLICSPAQQDRDLIQRLLREHRELAETLLKIRTEKVDFRSAIAEDLEQTYLSESSSPTKHMEARIYAQAVTEMHIAIIHDRDMDLSVENVSKVFLPVALKLLNLEQDKEAQAFLQRKIGIV